MFINANMPKQVVVTRYDDQRSKIIFRGRGSMPVDKESVHRMSELPNDGYKVVDEVEKEAIEYISSDSME